MPSAPRSSARSSASRSEAWSSGRSTLPSASILSRMPNARSRVTRGSGRRDSRWYGSGIFSRASSSTSMKFSVVNRHRRTPLRWITELMPTVVPWVK